MPTLESFVAEVMASWRADSGEPDVARTLPSPDEAEAEASSVMLTLMVLEIIAR